MGIGLFFTAIWVLLVLITNKHNHLFEDLDDKEHRLKQVYSVGYGFMELFRYKYKSKFDRGLRSELSVLYDERYVEYYIRVTYAQSVTYAFIVFLFAFVLYGLSRDFTIFLICLMMSGLAVYYFLTLSRKKIQKRSAELLSDFSEVVSKLALLTNAGMIMREAWNEVAFTNDRTIYLEMQKTCVDMDNGVSEMEAIRRFGVRCMVPEVKKFSATIIQGIEKGNKELTVMLRTQSDEIWHMKQQQVRAAGEKANTKLMLPMFIMFAGILIMIIVPIFTNLGV